MGVEEGERKGEAGGKRVSTPNAAHLEVLGDKVYSGQEKGASAEIR